MPSLAMPVETGHTSMTWHAMHEQSVAVPLESVHKHEELPAEPSLKDTTRGPMAAET